MSEENQENLSISIEKLPKSAWSIHNAQSNQDFSQIWHQTQMMHPIAFSYYAKKNRNF